MSITFGELNAAISAAPAFVAALQRVATGAGTLADVETIGEDALEAAMLADPAIAPFAGLAIELAPLLIDLFVASGIHISPDPDPEVDAQTAHGHGGRS